MRYIKHLRFIKDFPLDYKGRLILSLLAYRTQGATARQIAAALKVDRGNTVTPALHGLSKSKLVVKKGKNWCAVPLGPEVCYQGKKSYAFFRVPLPTKVSPLTTLQHVVYGLALDFLMSKKATTAGYMSKVLSLKPTQLKYNLKRLEDRGVIAREYISKSRFFVKSIMAAEQDLWFRTTAKTEKKEPKIITPLPKVTNAPGSWQERHFQEYISAGLNTALANEIVRFTRKSSPLHKEGFFEHVERLKVAAQNENKTNLAEGKRSYGNWARLFVHKLLKWCEEQGYDESASKLKEAQNEQRKNQSA